MKPKINFFCIGTQKAGTTTLHDILKQHPDIFLPIRKEAHFFDNEERYSKGLDWYFNEFFSEYSDEKIVGSITPEYSFYPQVPERIFNDLGPDIKFIFILRHPVDRALSHYNMSKGRLIESLSFDRAITIEKERIKSGKTEFNHFSYFSRGYYLAQIKRYSEYYPLDQFLFLDFDLHIRNNIDDTIKMIQDFLNVKSIPLNTNLHSNKAFTLKENIFTKVLKKNQRRSTFLKNCIPNNLKHKLKQNIIKLYTIENKNKLQLEQDTKKKLFVEYFDNMMPELQQITRLNLNHWYE